MKSNNSISYFRKIPCTVESDRYYWCCLWRSRADFFLQKIGRQNYFHTMTVKPEILHHLQNSDTKHALHCRILHGKYVGYQIRISYPVMYLH